MYTYQIIGQISYFYANFARKRIVSWKNLHSWQCFYTTAGRDGRDKFQVWAESHELSLNVACFDILILELLFKDIVPFMCLILFSLK